MDCAAGWGYSRGTALRSIPMKTVAALSPAAIDSAPLPPRGTSKKLVDWGSPHQRQRPALWRLKLRRFAEELLYSIGTYPDVGDEAAKAARDARKLVARGTDPIKIKREDKDKSVCGFGHYFRQVGQEFLDRKLEAVAPATRRKLEWQRRDT